MNRPSVNKSSEAAKWKRVCDALAEDALNDETPPPAPEMVSRVRARLARLKKPHKRGEANKGDATHDIPG